MVVLYPLMSVSPLELHQVCLDGLERGLPVVLGLTTGFTLFMQMVPQDLDVVMPPLSLQQPERRNEVKT